MAYSYRDLKKTDPTDFDAIRVGVASKDDILSWSYGEVLRPDTINYRTQKPEKDGLFCERIFGPVKDINPHDVRFKGARARNFAVDKKGQIVTKHIVRRERMGHISLAAPIVHIWFLRVTPNPLNQIFGLTTKNLERITYLNSYLILSVNEDLKTQLLKELSQTFSAFSQSLSKSPLKAEQFKIAIFKYLIKQVSKATDLNDVWPLLLEVDERLNEELINSVRQHTLYNSKQLIALNRALSDIYQLILQSEEIKKTKKADVLYGQFIDSKGADISSTLKAEFKKIDKELSSFASKLDFSLDTITDIYDQRLDKLKNAFKQYEVLTEGDYRDLPARYRSALTVAMGGEAIAKALEQIDLKQLIDDLAKTASETKGKKKLDILQRLKILRGMQKSGLDIKNFCLTVLPVVPPDLRPIMTLKTGNFAASDLNDLYRRVINRNNRLKALQELKAPEVICRNEKRILQEAVDALIDNSQQRGNRAVTTGTQQRKLKSLADTLKRKKGRFRQHILGKRVDFSARSVIAVGSNLSIHECGLPKTIALELFKPFVIGELLREDYAPNVKAAGYLIESGENIVWDILDRVIKDKYILLNRAPTLHRLGFQAFQPKLIDGKVIQLHPLVCKGFNADFDGDSMAVHLPLSKEAQAEARDLIASEKNIFHPSDGAPVLHLDQDIIMGLYYLTYNPHSQNKEIKHRFASMAEAIAALDADSIKLQTLIEIVFRNQRQITTVGRVLLNEILPEDLPFQDHVLNKAGVKQLMSLVYDRYDYKIIVRVADDLKNLAFKYATLSGLSIGMSDFFDVEGRDEVFEGGVEKILQLNQQLNQGLITDKERYNLSLNIWREVDSEIENLTKNQFERYQDSALTLIVDSGSRGKIDARQTKRILASVGIISDADGRPIEFSIGDSFYSGLPTLQYFIAARGGRKSLIDVALSTSQSGYLTRRLVYVGQDVFTVPEDENVVDPGFLITRSDASDMGLNFADRLIQRYAAADIKIDNKVILKKSELITPEIAQVIEDSDLAEVLIMSSLSTPSLAGIPIKSYGTNLLNNQLINPYRPVGVIAAQSIGEPSTQLKLDSKHTGGVAKIADSLSSTGLNRIDELFEARNPKGPAYLFPFDGTVHIKETEVGNDYEITLTASADYEMIIDISGYDACVKVKDEVSADQLLAFKADGCALVAPIAGSIRSLNAQTLAIKPKNLLQEAFVVPVNQDLLVENNQSVKRGEQLNEGSINLEQYLNIKGLVATQNYLLREIFKVFAKEGIRIAEKHLEVIIRQMFNCAKVKDSAGNDFVDGDIVSKNKILRENLALKEAGKPPIVWQQLIVGIAKVVTYADSFLVAAGFQDTTRILVNSAINGRVDQCFGLIENVILGRKIPVGTGSADYEFVDSEGKET